MRQMFAGRWKALLVECGKYWMDVSRKVQAGLFNICALSQEGIDPIVSGDE